MAVTSREWLCVRYRKDARGGKSDGRKRGAGGLFLIAVAMLFGPTDASAISQLWSSSSGCGAGVDVKNVSNLGGTSALCTDQGDIVPTVLSYKIAGFGQAVVRPDDFSLGGGFLFASGGAAAELIYDEEPAPFVFVQATGGASATVYFEVVPIQPIPTNANPDFIGLSFESSGSASHSGESSSANAIAVLFGGGITVVLYDTDENQGIITTSPLLRVGLVYAIQKNASCTAFANIDSPKSQCFANIDPFISFDQAGFDSMWGDESVNLADYYRVDFSPNFIPVPEPATACLLGLGLLGLTRFGGRPDARRADGIRLPRAA